jgi:large conductance mechanosensitive channel
LDYQKKYSFADSKKDGLKLEKFKKFAMSDDVVDMTVGFIIGGAFGTIVKSMASDIIMPPIGLMMGGVDFADLFLTLKKGAVAVSYGVFFNAVVSFVIVALAVFMRIRAINNMQKKEEAAPAPVTTKECPLYISQIAIKATRCPCCTGEVS